MKFSCQRIRRVSTWGPLVFLFILWGFLYLRDLRSNPSWFMDETKAMNCAMNTAHFSPSYLATWNTFFHPVTSYQPPYLFLTGIFARGDIWGARFFNALLALAIASMLYVLGRRLLGNLGAFFAALLFLTYDQTLIHFRAVYPHNGVAMGTTIAVLALCLYPTKKREWLTGLGLTIGAASHPMFIYPSTAAFLTRWNKPKSWIRLFAPTLIYLLIAMGLVYWRFGNWFFQDIQELARWYQGDTIEQGKSFFSTSAKFYFKDWFHIGALACMAYCIKKKFYVPVIFMTLISACLFQNRNDFADFYYQAVLLIPLLSLCWGKMLQKINQLLKKRRFFFFKKILFSVFAIFCIGQAGWLIWAGHLDPYYRHEIIQRAASAENIAMWLNQHTTSENTVVANSNICWLLHAKKVHYLQAAASEGMAALYYRDKVIPKERQLYDISIESANYIVLCEVDLLWEPSRSDIKILAEKMTRERWKKVFASEEYAIFENPIAPLMAR